MAHGGVLELRAQSRDLATTGVLAPSWLSSWPSRLDVVVVVGRRRRCRGGSL
jgi:hypothetical protein